MDPITAGLLGMLSANLGSIADWIVATTDKGRKTQLESLRSILEMAKAQITATSEENEKLKQHLREVTEEKDALAEKVAYFEVQGEYDMKEGLLYKKETGEGPYCPMDRIHMTVESRPAYCTNWKCPKCQHAATTRRSQEGDGKVLWV